MPARRSVQIIKAVLAHLASETDLANIGNTIAHYDYDQALNILNKIIEKAARNLKMESKENTILIVDDVVTNLDLLKDYWSINIILKLPIMVRWRSK
jgi:phospholipid N-methyltransferase